MNDQTRNSLPLVLGTAQLGMDYGIANKTGKPPFEDALAMTETAMKNGIFYFDTAQAYGESERILGNCFKKLRLKPKQQPKVISKFKPILDFKCSDQIVKNVDRSLDLLGIPTLWGLMLHKEFFLEGDISNLQKIVYQLKSENKILHFGISVYSPEKAIEALAITEIDIIQLPFNIFDQRAAESDVFTIARNLGKQVFVRSIYLQGLLLLNPDQIPWEMNFACEAIVEYKRICDKYNLSPALMALSFVRQNASGALFVIGSETPEQLMENISLFKLAGSVSLPELNELSSKDIRLINPSLWPRYEARH